VDYTKEVQRTKIINKKGIIHRSSGASLAFLEARCLFEHQVQKLKTIKGCKVFFIITKGCKLEYLMRES